MEQLMSLKFNIMFWTVVTFTIVLIVLWKAAWTPILKGLDERADKIQGDLDRADSIRKEAEQKLEDYNKQIATAKKEVEQVFADGRKAAEENKSKIMEAAEKEANEIKEKTKRDIEIARKNAVDGLRTYVAELVVFASKKVVSESMGTDEHKKLIDQAIKDYDAIDVDSKTSH